jgi:carboxypeptidase family protein
MMGSSPSNRFTKPSYVHSLDIVVHRLRHMYVYGRRCGLLLCIISVANLDTLSQSTPEYSPNLENVSGIVVNKLTREPISRALVFSPDNRMAALTDDDGRFQFKVPRDESSQGNSSFGNGIGGMTTFLARKPGFLQDSDGTQTLLPPDLVIALIPEAIIHGRVVTKSNEPAIGMNVQLFQRGVQEGLWRWTPSQTTHTNSSGEYRFAELPPGEYKVMTQELLDADPESLVPGGQVYGFPPSCFPGVADFTSGTAITLSAGQKLQADIPLARQPYYWVRLPVLNAEKTPGLNVSVLAQTQPGPGYSLGYNPSTHRIEGLLPNGTFRIQAHAFAPLSVNGEATFTISGHEVNSPSMTLAADGAIPISVQEQFNSEWKNESIWRIGNQTFKLNGPRVYLHLSLEPVEDFSQLGRPSLRPILSRADESLLIDNVPPGAYWVRFNTLRGYIQSMNSSGVDLLRHPLVVASSSPPQIDITVRDDMAQISGTVSDIKASGDSLPRRRSIVPRQLPARVYCVPLPDSNGTFQEIAVMPDGSFASVPMPPGAYRVLAFARPKPNLPYRDPVAMRVYETQGLVLNLVPGQSEHLQLPLMQGD